MAPFTAHRCRSVMVGRFGGASLACDHAFNMAEQQRHAEEINRMGYEAPMTAQSQADAASAAAAAAEIEDGWLWFGFGASKSEDRRVAKKLCVSKAGCAFSATYDNQGALLYAD